MTGQKRGRKVQIGAEGLTQEPILLMLLSSFFGLTRLTFIFLELVSQPI